MKKLAVLFICAVIISAILRMAASAYDVSAPDLSELTDNGIISESEASGETSISITDKLLSALSGGCTAALKSALPAFAGIVAVLVLSGTVSAFVAGIENAQAKTAFSLISVLALTLAVYPQCVAVTSYIAECADVLAKVMTAVSSGCMTLYILEGSAAAASTSAASMSVLGTVLSAISSGALMPFTQATLALAVSGALPGVADLSPISRFIKNTLTTVMAFLFTLYGFANYIQTAIATASDSYAYRTVRFSAGVLIPVIGNMLGEASRTVSGSISVMKATVGSAGIAAVLTLLLPPVLTVLCYRIMLNLASVIAGLLGCEREKRFLSDAAGIFGVLFALVAGIAVTALITLAMFIRMGVSA